MKDHGAEERVTADRTADRTTADIAHIKRLIPHRAPFLMIDRVEDIQPGVACVGIKNVTIGEPFFQGHFPSRPVMPGVLIIEALAQTAGVLVVETLGESARGKLVYFMSIDNARFRRPVVPGDVLRLHVEKVRRRSAVWKFNGEARVGDRLMAGATFAAMIMDET